MNPERVRRELLPRLRQLALAARAGGMHMTIDAEESYRLDPSLDLIEALARDSELAGWNGLGLAVQCYSRRATAVLGWVIALSQQTGRRFMVRLVKGAYWDSEIKRAQELGTSTYPVFTRKVSTDVCYLACAQLALRHPEAIYPQFATHNAHTIAAILEMAAGRRDCEFARLHGMGELLYAAIADAAPDLPRVRIYAPVGPQTQLLAYLVRRLLENGANSSFIHRFMAPAVTVASLVADPIEQVRSLAAVPNERIPSPRDLYGARRNSQGIDLMDPLQSADIIDALAGLRSRRWEARPSGMQAPARAAVGVVNPADNADVVGVVIEADAGDASRAVALAVAAQVGWDRTGAQERAQVLERAAAAIEHGREQLFSLLTREAGKTLPDAIAEVREAVDFCRYYAERARIDFGKPLRLASAVGEDNLYSLHGRGVFACISPWNFPLAIFVGQVAAALAAGNSVIAKPAEQTPLIAAAAVQLMREAGVPQDVLHLMPGRGEIVGAALVADERIAGVVFTGSTATAKHIARALANRDGPIIPLIAETGGQNAMIVDSSALPEQVVDDVLRSAFRSAGQRCSSLRVLYVQEEIADRVIDMLIGAMNELRVGDPSQLATDIGPVIDREAQTSLMEHVNALQAQGKLLYAVACSEECRKGSFVAPHLFGIDAMHELAAEHFGPILHVVRYRKEDLDAHLRALRETQFGLTLGVHSRIEAQARRIFDESIAGNVYVNRNMIGAVVGVQPFGGHGLSGTGPKAGGPLYLQRFAVERVVTTDTTAAGGNASLLTI